MSDINDFFQPLGGGRDILKDRPKLLSWKSRVQSALSDSFDDAHSVLYRLRDKAKLWSLYLCVNSNLVSTNIDLIKIVNLTNGQCAIYLMGLKKDFCVSMDMQIKFLYFSMLK